MKKYITINGKSVTITERRNMAAARQSAISICNHSKEILIREFNEITDHTKVFEEQTAYCNCTPELNIADLYNNSLNTIAAVLRFIDNKDNGINTIEDLFEWANFKDGQECKHLSMIMTNAYLKNIGSTLEVIK